MAQQRGGPGSASPTATLPVPLARLPPCRLPLRTACLPHPLRAHLAPGPASLPLLPLTPPLLQIRAYVEVHLEQGPVLEQAGRRLGLVAAIAGQSRLQAEIEGEQGHAGTVPMRLRRDALAAAAEVIAALERLCGGGSHEATEPRRWGRAAAAGWLAGSLCICVL